jgi:hypothetical protein
VQIERLLERLSFQYVSMVLRTVRDRADTFCHAARVHVSNQLDAKFLSPSVPEGDHLAQFPASIDVHQREWDQTGIEGFFRQAQHHRGIFANRIEHHGPGGGSGHFSDYFDRLGL